VLVPKAAVNKDHFLPANEREIRISWEVFSVQPESVSKSVSEPADQHFGLHSFAANCAHVRAAPVWREFVHLPLSSGDQVER
jgi:hypothetical protein